MDSSLRNVIQFMQGLLKELKSKEGVLRQECMRLEFQQNKELSIKKMQVQSYLKKGTSSGQQGLGLLQGVPKQQEIQSSLILSLESQIESVIRNSQVQVEELNEDQKPKQREGPVSKGQEDKKVVVPKSVPRQSNVTKEPLEQKKQAPQLTEKEILEQKKPPVPKQKAVAVQKVGNPKNQSSNMSKALNPTLDRQKSSQRSLSAKASSKTLANTTSSQLSQVQDSSKFKISDTIINSQVPKRQDHSQQLQQVQQIQQPQQLQQLQQVQQIQQPQQLQQLQQQQQQQQLQQPQKGKQGVDLFEKASLEVSRREQEEWIRSKYIQVFRKERSVSEQNERGAQVKGKLIAEQRILQKDINTQVNQVHQNDKYYRERIQQSRSSFKSSLYKRYKERVDSRERGQQSEFYEGLEQKSEEMVQGLAMSRQYSKILEKFVRDSDWEVSNIEMIIKNAEKYDIIDIFKVWYFCNVFQQNFKQHAGVLRPLLKETRELISRSQQVFKAQLGNSFQVKQQAVLVNPGGNLNSKINSLMTLSVYNDSISLIQKPLKDEKLNQEIDQINQEMFQIQMKQIINSILQKHAFPRIKSIIEQKKVSIESLKSILKEVQSLICITGYKGKIVPSIFLTEILDEYIQSLK